MWVIMLVNLYSLRNAVLALSCLCFPLLALLTCQLVAFAQVDDNTANLDRPAKALVVLVYDQHCKAWCTKVRPIMKELGDELGSDVNVVEIDSSATVSKTAIKTAEDLGIIRYYKDVDMVPVVMIFDAKKKLMHELGGPKTKETYKAAILSTLKNAK